MRKGKSRITLLSILTTIAILVWVISEAYSRLNRTELTSIPEKVLAPITPSLDPTVLDNMEERLWFPDEGKPEAPPILRQEPEATQNTQVSPAPESSPSGDLQ